MVRDGAVAATRLLGFALAVALVACAAHSGPSPWPKEALPMVVVAMSCDRDPSALDHWFPGSLTGPRGSRPSHRCVAAAVIRSYQEPVLPAQSSGETYRLVYEPSFSPPVVIRIEAGGREGRATIKRDHSKGEELSGSFETVEGPVELERLESLRHALQAAGCWSAGSICHASSEDGSNLTIVDGSSWVLEGVRGTEHWAVEVAHPEEGPFLAACRTLIDAADAGAWIAE